MSVVQSKLRDLLIACFSADELRRFVREISNEVADSLPGHAVSQIELASAAVDLLRRWGLINKALFEKLIAERPIRRIAIRALASEFGVTDIGVSRGVTPPKPADGVVEILFTGSSPATTYLGLDIEARGIQNALEASANRGHFRLHLRPTVRVDDLVHNIVARRPQIVHFAGHGVQQEGLIFANARNQLAFVEPNAMSEIFAVVNDHAGMFAVRCVVLSACMSSSQAQAIVKHVDCVVGMKHGVQDEVAIRFARIFYAALAEGRSVGAAYEFACMAVDLDEPTGGDGLALFERESGLAHQMFFVG